MTVDPVVTRFPTFVAGTGILMKNKIGWCKPSEEKRLIECEVIVSFYWSAKKMFSGSLYHNNTKNSDGDGTSLQ